jgi:hypothetical protein
MGSGTVSCSRLLAELRQGYVSRERRATAHRPPAVPPRRAGFARARSPWSLAPLWPAGLYRTAARRSDADGVACLQLHGWLFSACAGKI